MVDGLRVVEFGRYNTYEEVVEGANRQTELRKAALLNNIYFKSTKTDRVETMNRDQFTALARHEDLTQEGCLVLYHTNTGRRPGQVDGVSAVQDSIEEVRLMINGEPSENMRIGWAYSMRRILRDHAHAITEGLREVKQRLEHDVNKEHNEGMEPDQVLRDRYYAEKQEIYRKQENRGDLARRFSKGRIEDENRRLKELTGLIEEVNEGLKAKRAARDDALEAVATEHIEHLNRAIAEQESLPAGERFAEELSELEDAYRRHCAALIIQGEDAEITPVTEAELTGLSASWQSALAAARQTTPRGQIEEVLRRSGQLPGLRTDGDTLDHCM